jgi:hypothetical protein
MATTKQEGGLDARTKAVRLAMLQESDADDFRQCVREVQASTGLSAAEARIVAGALRSEMLPKVAESLGLEEDDIADFANKLPDEEDDVDGEQPTTDFADDKVEDEDDFVEEPQDDTAAIRGDALDMGGEDAIEDDMSDEDDLGTEQTLEIQVPTGKVDEIQEAIRSILGDDAFGLGGDSEFNFEDDEEGDFGDENFEDKPWGDDDDLNLEDENIGEEAPNIGKQVISMSNKQKAGREVRAADEQVKPKDRGLGSDTSHGGKPFQYAADAQYQGEDTRPGMTLEDSAGNSLRDQNPTFADATVPAKNPERLQLKNSYKTFTYEGADGDIEYDMSSEVFEVPSAGEKAGGEFEVPTQMTSTLDRKTTVATLNSNVERVAGEKATDDSDYVTANNEELYVTSDNRTVGRDEFEEHVIDTLVASGMTEKEVLAMSFAEGLELYGNIVEQRTAASNAMGEITRAHAERQARINKLAADLTVEITGGTEEPDGTEETLEEALKESREAMRDTFIREAELFKKRVKAAYGVTTRLVIAGIINDNEVDNHVDTWLKDNLSVGAMLKQGNFMLRAASKTTDRTVQSGNSGNTRTAGVSVNPALVTPNLGSTQEVKDRLANLFTVGGIPRNAFDAYKDNDNNSRDF